MTAPKQKSLSEILDEIEYGSDGWTLSLLLETNAALVKALRRAVEMLKWAVEGDAALLHHHKKELAQLLTSPADHQMPEEVKNILGEKEAEEQR